MRVGTKEKKEILGDIDIQPLLNMRKILRKSFKKIESKVDFTELEEMGIIKGFELSYELIWKTLKKFLNVQGVEALSPREVFRLSSQFGYLENPQIWFEFGKERNLTTHVYNENVFRHIIIFIPEFLIEFEKVVKKLENLK